MNRKAVKTIAAVIACVMILGLVASLFSNAFMVFGVSNKTKLAELRKQLSSAKQTTSQIKGEISALSNDKSAQMDRKMALEQQINSTQEEISITEELLEELNTQIKQRRDDLAVAQQKEAEQYELFKTRIKTMYENNSTTTLDMIFGAASFTEIFAKLEYTQDIAAYDKKIMANLTATREYIEELKSGLEDDRKEQEGLKAELIVKEGQLTQQTIEVEQIIDELNLQIKENTLTLEEAQKIQATYQRQIAETEAAIRKAEAEEARRKAAAAAAAKKKNNSSGNSAYSGSMKWPLSGYYKVSSDFSMRTHPITGVYSQHTGIDIPAPRGTSIRAASSGTVITVGYNGAYGNRVVISHGGGITTLYGHMSRTAAKVGQEVSAGDTIGYVGSTGFSTGNHLHFSVLKNGSYVNPWNYVSK